MDTGAIGKAQALRLYARQRKDAELEMQMAEIRLRAYRRIGEISSELERTDEDTRFGSDGVSTGGHPGELRMLKNAGITHAVAVPARPTPRSRRPSSTPSSRATATKDGR
jgi:hypothetical protein